MISFFADNARKALLWGISILAVLIIAGYTYYEFHPFLLGPVIIINSPTSGTTIAAPLVAVTGIAKNITEITLNGRPISIDEQGRFNEEAAVPEGYAILTLAARDRFGRTAAQTIQLWRQPSPDIPVITSSSTSSHATSSEEVR